MRLCIVSQEYPPGTAHGGIAIQARAKAEGLARRGHDVTVISHSTTGPREEHEGPHGVRVVRLPGPDTRLPLQTAPARWLTWSVEVAAEVAASHARGPYDLVEFAEYGAEGYVHLLNQAPWARVTTVLHLHGPLVMMAHALGWPPPDDELSRTGVEMERTCIRLADYVYSSSAYSAGWCARMHGLDEASTPVLHLGVDTTRFKPLRQSPGPSPVVAFVGKLTKTKGVEVVVGAATSLAGAHPGLRVRLIGRDEGGIVGSLQERVAAAGWPDLLDIRGHVAQEDLPQALAGATVLAAPGLCEGGPGLVYLEAMACGVPVVASAGSGASEVVRNGENGVLVPPGDVAALARVLGERLDDRDGTAAMGRRGRAWVVAEADTERSLDVLEVLFEDAVAGLTWKR